MRTAIHRLLCLFLVLTISAPASVGSGSPAQASSLPATLPPTRLFPAWAAPSQEPPPPGVFEPALARVLAQARPDDIVRVIVVLRQQPDPQQAVLSAATRAEARSRLVAVHQSLAERTQAPLRAYLEEAQAAGTVESYTPF